MNNENYSISEFIHFYEVKMNALTSYSDAVWNRFNWLLTLQLGAFGLFFTKLNNTSSLDIDLNVLPIIGAVISVLWVIVGRSDYISLSNHKNIVRAIESRLQKDMNESWDELKTPSYIRQSLLLYLFPLLVLFFWIYLFFV